MPSVEPGALRAWLDRVIESTLNGSIRWVSVNPTTYSWDATNPPGKVILQGVERVEKVMEANRPTTKKTRTHLLNVVDMQRGRIVTTLDGAEDVAANTQLDVLFGAVKSIEERELANFLQSMLPPEKKDQGG
jgi:hypothetical protein